MVLKCDIECLCVKLSYNLPSEMERDEEQMNTLAVSSEEAFNTLLCQQIE